MVEKEVKEETKDEIKEKDVEVTEEPKVVEEKEVETPIVETAKETELENDPWSQEAWKSSFPELFETEVVEKAEGLSKDDVVRICRDQIKVWLKGTSDGSYPLPKSMTPTEQKSLNKIKDIEGLNEQLEKSATAYKSFEEKFTDIAKTFEEIKSEVQIIKDTPIEIIEKSTDSKNKYIPSVKMDEGKISKR